MDGVLAWPMKRWNTWLTPRATNRDERFRERTIRGTAILMAFIALTLGIMFIAFQTPQRVPQALLMLAICGAALVAIHKGHAQIAGWLVISIGITFSMTTQLQVGYWATGTIAASILTLITSSLLLPPRAARLTPVLLTVIYTILAFWVESRGIISPLSGVSANALGASISFIVIILTVAGAQSYLLNEFNSQRQELKDLIETLEDRVLERTRDLQIAANVSQQVTQILDLNQLLPMLTEQTRAAFELYHVSVFLLDNNGETLRLHAGTGEAGVALVKAGKQFQLDDHGLVPLTARQQQSHLVNDVQQSPDYQPNPYLPNTRSEVAVPMLIGSQLIGVLDLQSEQLNKFNDDDIKVLTTLAEQIAIAVRNAYLFAETQMARHEAEKANSVKSQFLASMSHELRTPLNAILNFTQFVSTGMLGSVNDEQVDMLQKVTYSGKHLLGLINDILDISKIEAGALKLFVEENVDLAKEAQAVMAATRGLIGEKPVILETSVADNLPHILADRRRIRQIMLNLMSNACKFTEQGSIRLVLEYHANQILFAVHDTGPGIAPEDATLVFETFRQSETGLRQGEGTGLGLPISRRLAEAHGGNLWFESTIGEGTHFYVTLPVRSPELEALVVISERT
jgi:signal transduction histidine kinase